MESITFYDIINDKEYLFIPKEKPIQIKTDHHVSAESIFSNNDGYNKIKIKESKKTPWVKTDHSLKKDFDKDILEHNYYVKPDEINELQEIMKELDYISLEIKKLLYLIDIYSTIDDYFNKPDKLQTIYNHNRDTLKPIIHFIKKEGDVLKIIKEMEEKEEKKKEREQEEEEKRKGEEERLQDEYKDKPIINPHKKLLECLVNRYIFDDCGSQGNIYDNHFLILDATMDQEKINYDSLKDEHFDCTEPCNRVPLLFNLSDDDNHEEEEKEETKNDRLKELFESNYLYDNKSIFLNKYLELEPEPYEGELKSDYDTGFELSNSTGLISHWNFKAEDPYIIAYNKSIDSYKRLIRHYHYYSNIYDLCIEELYNNKIDYSIKGLKDTLNKKLNVDPFQD